LLMYTYSDELDRVWDTIKFIDTLGRTLIEPGVPVYGVELIDSFLWVGSWEGTVRINLNDGEQLYIGIVDSTSEVYAFPLPFSPLRG